MESALEQAWQKEQSRLRPTVLTLDAVQWAGGPSRDLFLVPEDLTSLWGTDGYNRLSKPQQIAYNQFYAQQLAEEFRWIETQLICAPLICLCEKHRDPDSVSEVLSSFVDDEMHHVSCFDHLATLAAQTNGHQTPFFQPPKLVRYFARAAAAAPGVLPFWIAVIEAFETYALTIGQRYRDAKDIDSLFRSVFMMHSRDEARHCQYDVLLRNWLVVEQAGWLKQLNGYLSQRFSKRYYAIDWGLDGPINALVSAVPELADQFDMLMQDAQSARSDDNGANSLPS